MSAVQLYIVAAVMFASFTAGCYFEHLFVESSLVREERVQAKDLGLGEAAIIKEDAKLNKEFKDANDPCLDKPLPSNIR